MKIMFVSQYYPPFIGGVPTMVSLISKELVSRGLDLTVVASKFKNSDRFDKTTTYKTMRVPIVEIKRLYALSFMLNVKLSRIKWDSFDIIHCHNPASTVSIGKTSKPIITTFYGFYKESFSYFSKIPFITKLSSILENKAIEKSDIVTTVSYSHLLKLKEEHTDKEFVHVPNYVDTQLFKPLSIEKENVILYVGHLYQLKNIDSLIKAFSIVSQKMKDVKLWIVGDGPQREELEQLSKSLGLNDIVKFWGTKTGDDLVEFYNKARLHILPSKTEGLPLAPLEAMSCGTPALISNVSDAVYMVDSNYIINDLSSKGIAEKIIDVWDGKIQDIQLRKNIIDKYSKEKVINKYISIYKRLVK